MDADATPLTWSAQFSVSSSSSASKLKGDKIILPPSALEALLSAAPVVSLPNQNGQSITSTFDPFNPYSYAAEREAREYSASRQQQLPHPLTFRIVNPHNDRVVYAGIREFSAEEGEVILSDFLVKALGIDEDRENGSQIPTSDGDMEMLDGDKGASQIPRLTIHAKQIPRGTYVRLRPLEAGYDAEDWKSLLERVLRDNFTTLTKDEILSVRGGRNEEFRFLVDKFTPDVDGICVVDTDLEVDIEPLNEDQARETLKRKLEKNQRAPGTAQGSSTGGSLNLGQELQGRVLLGEYVDYELQEWPRDFGIEVVLETSQADAELDLFLSPFASYQRARPREDEHAFGDFESRPSKRIRISPSNVELENAEKLYISVHAWSEHDVNHTETETLPSSPIQFSIQAISDRTASGIEMVDQDTPPTDEIVCKNCQQSIPKRTMPLHEAFCYRNNVLCPSCKQVFQKRSEDWQNHWHCPHDDSHGNSSLSKHKHELLFHALVPYTCSSCDSSSTFSSLSSLAQHRTHSCPSKLILCQFCHLVVPQCGPEDLSLADHEVLLSGLTPHELSDGARTTECHVCSRIIRLRDMKTHFRHHDLDRISRPAPQICANPQCGRSIPDREKDMIDREHLGLCGTCFGPLYVTSYDPEGKALRRRVERRLLQQLSGGCGKQWCQGFCRTAKKNSSGSDTPISTKDALPMIRPIMDKLNAGEKTGIPFCVDEGSQKRRVAAEVLSAEGEGGYALEWWVRALEENNGDATAARSWLEIRAPRIGEKR
ncbi:MAG: hypothetical protein Q9160_006102 [Pyrenula sp. 1 TL-2023]